MPTCFSEFTFGYAAIREAESTLAQIYRSAGAPVLPSLRLEATHGWDAKVPMLEYALFLQFKRPEFISRRHPGSPTWDHIGNPHYRFAIRTGEHQYQRLLELENDIANGAEVGDVYYVAPRFHRQADFDDAYLSGRVLERSSIVAPAEFENDGTTHHYATDASTGAPTIMSQPRSPRRRTNWSTLQERAFVRAERRPRRTDRLNLRDLEEILIGRTHSLDVDNRRDRNAPITRRIDRLATVLGCGLVLLGSWEDQ